MVENNGETLMLFATSYRRFFSFQINKQCHARLLREATNFAANSRFSRHIKAAHYIKSTIILKSKICNLFLAHFKV